MTQLDIETFFAVLEHPTMTAAARVLFITQPSLSARLQALEREAGAVLFQRGKGQRRLELTEEGRRFLPLARRWKGLLEETARFSAVPHQRFLHVAAVYTANQYFLPPVYEALLARMEQVSLQVEALRNYEAISFVAQGNADLAIVDSLARYEYRMESRPLFREGWLLLRAQGAPVPAGPVHPHALDPAAELLVSWQQEIRQWHDEWFGADAWPLLYTDIPQLVERMDLSGGRWSIIPASSAAYFRQQGQVCPLAHPPAERTFYLITRKGEPLSPPAQMFLELLGEHLAGVEGVRLLI